MKIGDVARQSGLPSKTIRYYEEIGLIRPAIRQDNGYRDYDDRAIRMLHFVKRARGLGFSVADCRNLLSLYQDRDRASADVKALARHRVEDIDRKVAELQDMRQALLHLIDRCQGDDRPDCPIIDDLAGTHSPP